MVITAVTLAASSTVNATGDLTLVAGDAGTFQGSVTSSGAVDIQAAGNNNGSLSFQAISGDSVTLNLAGDGALGTGAVTATTTAIALTTVPGSEH